MKVLVCTSTFPSNSSDKVPDFVRQQIIEMRLADPKMEFVVLAPHSYGITKEDIVEHEYYKEYRFHYFWLRRMETLTTWGILPALRQNPLMYFVIPFFALSQLMALYRVVTKENPDVLYAHWFTPQAINVWIVSLLKNKPFVFTTHASDVSILAKFPFTKYLVRTISARAQAITAVSQKTLNKLIKFLDKKTWKQIQSKTFVLPMGTDLIVTKSNQSASTAFLKKLGIQKEEIVILFLGRLAEKKGVEYLIKAYSTLSTIERKKTTLIIAGDGYSRTKLEKLSKPVTGRIIFAGFVSGSQKSALIGRANIICIPSVTNSQGDEEGMPVVLIEALSLGKIVIISSVANVDETIRHGLNGFVFKQKDPNAIRHAIRVVSRKTRRELDTISQQAIKDSQKYSWKNLVPNYINIFKGDLS